MRLLIPAQHGLPDNGIPDPAQGTRGGWRGRPSSPLRRAPGRGSGFSLAPPPSAAGIAGLGAPREGTAPPSSQRTGSRSASRFPCAPRGLRKGGWFCARALCSWKVLASPPSLPPPRRRRKLPDLLSFYRQGGLRSRRWQKNVTKCIHSQKLYTFSNSFWMDGKGSSVNESSCRRGIPFWGEPIKERTLQLSSR